MIESSIHNILKVRLFGFGIPYRARVNDGGVEPLLTSADHEAEDLVRALAMLAGDESESVAAEDDSWALSVPFGRCGLDGWPREHLMVFGAAEAYLDVLGRDEVRLVEVESGQIVAVEPRTVVRLRARPVAGRRVLVAFQTQDRTPLLGHAAPFTLDGVVPDDYAERLRRAHAAFAEVQTLCDDDREAYRNALDRFFGDMAERLEGDEAVATASAEARRAGSYDVTDERELFEFQQSMLDASLLERIRAQDGALFRFPGMFGAIVTLFNYLKQAGRG